MSIYKAGAGVPSAIEIEGTSTKDEQDGIPAHLTPRSPQPRPLLSPLSPSIYSRNTDGMSILPNDSVMSFDDTNDGDATHGSGSAVIITCRSVKSYTIGTPSPKHGTDSNRSSRDWKTWLSHEISELDANARSDYTFQSTYTPTIRQYSPPTRHHREFSQIGGDEATTVIMRESMENTTPRNEPEAEDPTIMETVEQSDTSPPVVAEQSTLDTPPSLVEPSVGLIPKQETPSPPLLAPSAIPRKQRLSSLSSAFSQRSSVTSNTTNSTPKSARMNDRFPFIKSNRRSSSQNANLRRTSQTPIGHNSGSSSLNSKATPSPKLYSDFSAPSTSRTSKYEPGIRSKSSEEVVNQNKELQKESQKENVTPTTQIRRPGQLRTGSATSLPLAVARPKSMLPLSSAALNRSPSTLSQNITTAEEGKDTVKQGPTISPERSPRRQRLKVKMQPISPSKLTARPRSAFDLRSAKPPPNVNRAITSSPKKDETNTQHPISEIITPYHRKYTSSRISTGTAGLDTDALRMLLESPWAVCGPSPSPRTSFELMEATRPQLRSMHSSSTLALNKEPSPGLEERIIDSILVCEDKAVSVRSGVEGGRVTPGHRMAERFLQERGASRGIGSGTLVGELDWTECAGSGEVRGLVREDTPAFL
jgi:hypothetical protein